MCGRERRPLQALPPSYQSGAPVGAPARLKLASSTVQHTMALVEGPLTTQEIQSTEFGLSWFFTDKAFRLELVDFFSLSQWDRVSGCLLVHCLPLATTGLVSPMVG